MPNANQLKGILTEANVGRESVWNEICTEAIKNLGWE